MEHRDVIAVATEAGAAIRWPGRCASPDLRRLRAGRYRVFCTIDEERRVIQIDYAARLPWP